MAGAPGFSLPALIEAIRRLSEQEVYVGLQTSHGLLGSPRAAEALARVGLREFGVALYGSAQAMHDYHAGKEGAFRAVALAVRLARAVKIPVRVTSLVTRSNYRHLVDLVRLVRALGAEALGAQWAFEGSLPKAAPRWLVSKVLASSHWSAAAGAAKRLGLRLSSEDIATSHFPHAQLLVTELGLERALDTSWVTLAPKDPAPGEAGVRGPVPDAAGSRRTFANG